MADFCKEWSIKVWGQDTSDLKGLCEEGRLVSALCEGCGDLIQVDHNGLRVERYRIVEERPNEDDSLLASYRQLEDAESWLCHYLNQGMNAYLIDSEESL